MSGGGGGLGGIVGAVTGTVFGGGQGDKMIKQAGKTAQASQDLLRSRLARLDELELPDIEKEKIRLQLLDELDFLQAQEIDPASIERMRLDPRFQSMQMQYMSDLEELAQQGLTAEDRMVRQQLLDQEAARDVSQRADIERQMAERGTLDSGAQLATRLAAQQGSMQRGQQAALQQSAQAQQARLQALQGRATMAGQMQDQGIGVQKQNQQVQQQLAQLNQLARQRADEANLGARQTNVNRMNEQEMYNKGLYDRDFQRRFNREVAAGNMASGLATNMSNQSAAQAAGGAQQKASDAQLVGGLAKPFVGGLADKIFK